MKQVRLVVIVLLLAGCLSPGEETATVGTNSGDAPSPQAVAEFDETTGAIEGVVTGDSLEPLAAADVTLDGSVLASTDQFGRFVFSHIAPGPHTLVAQAANHAPAFTEVDLEAGMVATVNLVLTPIPGTQPYSTTLIHQGFWDCSVAAIVGVPNCLNMTGVQKIGFGFDVGSEWRTSQIELTWTYSNVAQTTTPGAWFSNAAETEDETGGCLGEVAGQNPLRLRLAPGDVLGGLGCATVAADYSTPTPATAYHHEGFVFPWGLLAAESKPIYNLYATGNSRGVGASFNQPFTMYLSVFYFEPAPSDFSAMPDQ